MSTTPTPDAEMLRTDSLLEDQTLKEHLSTNNSLPSPRTLKHLATTLRDDGDPETTLRTIKPHLERRYSRAAPKRIASTAHTAADTLGKAVKQTVPLFKLPKELIDSIVDLLDPADVVCLAQACGKLRRELDYSLPDLQRFSLAWVFDKRLLGMKLRRFVFEATERLDRDRLHELERLSKINSDEQGEPMLVCHVCIKPHPARYFCEFHLQLPVGRRRRCIASWLRIPLCEHGSENHSYLRYWRQSLLTAVGGYTTLTTHQQDITMACDYEDGQPRCPGYVDLSTNSSDELVITRRITLVRFIDPPALTADRIAKILAERPALRLCQHIQLGNAAVMREAYDPVIMLPGARAGGRRGRCRECATSWWFGIESIGLQPRRSGRCFLSVKTVVGDLKDPWDLRYLRLADRDKETEAMLAIALSPRADGALMSRKRRFQQLE